MATNTTNYGWTKPSYEDEADIMVINDTIDNIDAQVKTNENNILSTAAVGTCETSGNTAAKVVTISESSYTPHKGSIIAVKFKYSNNVTDTESTPITLNVNNSGAYRVWYKDGNYANASQGKIFGLSGYYIYYMYDGVDRWVWINYCMDNTYALMSQAEASAGTATNERLISAKVLSDTINEKLQPVENNISSLNAAKMVFTTKGYYLSQLNWTAMGTGMFYSDAESVTGISKIYAVSYTGASNLRTTDMIIPSAAENNTKVRLLSNTDTFANANATVTITIIGTA